MSAPDLESPQPSPPDVGVKKSTRDPGPQPHAHHNSTGDTRAQPPDSAAPRFLTTDAAIADFFFKYFLVF